MDNYVYKSRDTNFNFGSKHIDAKWHNGILICNIFITNLIPNSSVAIIMYMYWQP